MGFIFSPTITHKLRNIAAVSSRLAVATISTKPPLRIITAYAPQSKQTEQIKDNFYNQLEKLMDHKACSPTILVGDFNARLHYRDSGEHPHIGKHFIGRGKTYSQNSSQDTQDNRLR